MHYVTASSFLNPTSNKKVSQWSELDKLFHQVREQEKIHEGYGKLYFELVVQRDREWFTGNRTWAQIKSITTLPIPTRREILQLMGVAVFAEDDEEEAEEEMGGLAPDDEDEDMEGDDD
ncbi:hypothetical protein CROQUDRAFT_666243 [Cronartium quercuum f. sp. fusiforme G11]|uniref:Uncharacterized protein n=1 Tax=Cronartium quercuum f. sp. fusiforme G11 TaxID=708437 RepID=A0A9P6T5J9_9BASI|nr:hypothetical protein CROQUDRAFT_666243 [Cronartium quercuum f. sp. fusiforme G11]